ncbi:SDR family NAD(P)-dependent oxidoreductase [Streptomyces tauricus]|uniref:SDR family NAD(P)-dependent oxidoreductase n=1 Tax=Streptomyces tauricus TaxID=68274 RepID=UPI0033B9E17E
MTARADASSSPRKHGHDTRPLTRFITGASAGLGRALAETLLHEDHRVAAAARDTTNLAPLKDTYRQQLWTADLDVTDTGRLRTVVGTVFEDLTRVDHIVSNAAFGLYGAAEELDDRDIKAMLDTNLVAPVQLLRAAGRTGMAGAGIYHASKWGRRVLRVPPRRARPLRHRHRRTRHHRVQLLQPCTREQGPQRLRGRASGRVAPLTRPTRCGEGGRHRRPGQDGPRLIENALTGLIAEHRTQLALAHSTDR